MGRMTATEVAARAAQELSHKLFTLTHQSIPILLLVSGGSALHVLDNIPIQALSSNLTIGVLDERHSPDSSINNFTQFMGTQLYSNARHSGCHFIDTRYQLNESARQLADRFATALHNWKKHCPTGQVVITQGMGIDGHTAGIMPFPEDLAEFEHLFNQKDIWVIAYDAGSKNPYPLRVTTTLSFLKQVDFSIFYVCGVEKKLALTKVYAAEETLAATPARVVREMKSVKLFSDLSSFIHHSESG